MNTAKESFIEIELDKLKLDKQNPRLPEKVKRGEDNIIIDFLLKEENTIDVMQSIATNGFFAGEPLLVIPDDGNYTVMEGNRRLTALRLLKNPLLAEAKKKSVASIAHEAQFKSINKIPCVLFTSRNDVINYLGYRHVTGVQPWDALAKARYVKNLFEHIKEKDIDEKCKRLARILGSGSRSDYIKKLLCSLKLYQKIEDTDFYDGEIREKDIYFSLITTAIANKKIYTFLGLESPGDFLANNISDEALKKLTFFMFKKEDGKTVLGESRNLTKLAHVVSDKTALAQLEAGNPLGECFLYVKEGVSSVVSAAIDNALKHLRIAKDYATTSSNISLDETPKTQLEIIITTATVIKKLARPDD